MIHKGVFEGVGRGYGYKQLLTIKILKSAKNLIKIYIY